MTTPDTPSPLRVVFVCTANLARSAYAHVRASAAVPDGRVEFASGGVLAVPDRPMDPPMADELRRRGIDPSTFRSRRADRALMADADLVLTMTAQHREMVLRNLPAALRSVFTVGQFTTILEATDHNGADLLAWAGQHRPRASADADVADPYGQGQQAAQRTADLLDAFVTMLVPRLLDR